MKNVYKINKDLYYIGCSDRKIALFENVYPVPDGVSYNSYFLDDDKTVLFDTVDKTCAIQFFENLEYVLKERALDYLVINHLEPDHSALIQEVYNKYPNIKIICNQKIKQMLFQFFNFKNDIENAFEIIKEGDIISTGHHELTFVMAPMVHWPEVMVTYDKTDKILFCADAFGSFGAINGNIFDTDYELNIDEYRRYYTNIVGKYGAQVNMLLNKAKNLEINMLCPLHGLIIKENITKLVDLYSKWANYTPEIKSALILYASVYGATQNTSEILAAKLAYKGVKNIKMYDVSHGDFSYILSDAFKYSHIVIASTTYNNAIFVKMSQFIEDMVAHNLQNRTFSIIENGSWAPVSANLIKTELEKIKNNNFIDSNLSIKSTLKDEQESILDNLAEAIYQDINK